MYIQGGGGARRKKKDTLYLAVPDMVTNPLGLQAAAKHTPAGQGVDCRGRRSHIQSIDLLDPSSPCLPPSLTLVPRRLCCPGQPRPHDPPEGQPHPLPHEGGELGGRGGGGGVVGAHCQVTAWGGNISTLQKTLGYDTIQGLEYRIGFSEESSALLKI